MIYLNELLGNKFHAEAVENAIGLHMKAWGRPVITPLPQDYFFQRANNHPASQDFHIVIKILAFKRSTSLLRLWNSLLAADFAGRSDVDVEILIDAPRSPSEKNDVDDVTRVAKSFQWPFGDLKVTERQRNLGISGQWREAWTPSGNSEFAFILEDDLEVSPLFFKWASAAISTYYDSFQREAHESLLAVFQTNDFKARLEAYVKKYAGMPVLFGVCLQRQHVDPLRYPRKLKIENAYLPYLYSLIGTWGPLLFPLPWLAFRKWWEVHLQQPTDYVPFIDGSITNEFFKANPRIWSPWNLRFAYGTGLKFLYPNLPGKLSLVTNFREAGENYVQSKGAATETVTGSHILNDTRILTGLSSFPSINYLAMWQFDVNLRRVGALGFDRPCSEPSCSEPAVDQPRLTEYFNYVSQAIRWGSSDDRSSLSHFSRDLWVSIVDVIHKYISSDSIIAHSSVTPLLFLLHNYVNHIHPIECTSINNFLFKNRVLCIDQPGYVAVLDFRSSSVQLAKMYSSLYLTSAAYLVILGACNSAPTTACDDAGTCFEFVESVCAESTTDMGGSLYK